MHWKDISFYFIYLFTFFLLWTQHVDFCELCELKIIQNIVAFASQCSRIESRVYVSGISFVYATSKDLFYFYLCHDQINNNTIWHNNDSVWRLWRMLCVCARAVHAIAEENSRWLRKRRQCRCIIRTMVAITSTTCRSTNLIDYGCWFAYSRFVRHRSWLDAVKFCLNGIDASSCILIDLKTKETFYCFWIF